MMSSSFTNSGLREQDRKKRSGRSGCRTLMCPATTDADVDRHTAAFDEAVAALAGATVS